MALVVKDRVQETTTTTGTGTFTLAGAVSGFQSFSVIGDGNTTYYAIVGGTEWEVGLGTYTSSGTLLSRDTILESSNGGTAVNFSAGTKNVFVTYPAERALYTDASSNAIALGTPASATLTNATGLPLTTGVTGTLPIANGGTGSTSTTYASLTANVTGTLPVANGGTGLSTTPTNGQLDIGNGTNFTRAALTGTANQVVVTNGAGTITLSTPQSIGTASSVQFGSFGVGTAASGTTGEIRATNNVTAFYSSDKKLKENIKDVENALEKVCVIGSKTFDWTDEYIKEHGGEDSYFVQKSDFGVIAQDVQTVFPQAVRTRADGTLAVDYEKLSTLAFGAIKELSDRVKTLEGK